MAIATVVSTGAALLQPWPLKVLVDYVLGGAPMPDTLSRIVTVLPGTSTTQGLLVWVVAASLLIFVLDSVADAVLTLEWTRVGRGMVYDLARDLFARAQRWSLVFHSRRPVADSMSRITEDAWCVHTVVDTLLFGPGHALLALATMVALMAALDPALTLLALAVAPPMALAAYVFGRPIRSAAHERRESESRIDAHVQQTLASVAVVQAFSREEHERRRFQEYAHAAVRAHQRSALVGSMYGLGSGLVTTAGTAVVLWAAAMRVLDGHLTTGSTLVFLSYVHVLQTQLAAFVNVYTLLQNAGASIDRVHEVLGGNDGLPDRQDGPHLTRVAGDVAFDDVSFAYGADRLAVRSVTFSVRAGEMVAIVGPSGAGKSTLVSLIPRLIDPLRGRVLIDGRDLRDLQLSSVRAQVAVVLQEPFLFAGTVAENIAFGRAGSDRPEVERAAKVANAHDFIVQLPGGYDTVLGERGATLSGGERQRIAIARAVVRNAPILVLDESTSALDVETEWAVLEALGRLMRGRTTFVIAHRLSTVRRADRILVLEDGRLVEQGTLAELLALGGRYSRLHHQQFIHGAEGSPAA